jgi:hypothetical protein
MANAGILQLCDKRAAVRLSATPEMLSRARHDIVIKPIEDVLS